MNRMALVVGGLVVIPLVLFLALAFRYDPGHIESPLIGRPAPSFTLVDLEGRKLSLEELRGKPVVLNFWASWCQPCLVEHGLFRQSANFYRGKAHFVGIIYQDSPQAIRNILARHGVWGPSLIDDDNRVAIAYGVYGVPETFFIDASGIVVEKVAEPLLPQTLRSLVDNLIDS